MYRFIELILFIVIACVMVWVFPQFELIDPDSDWNYAIGILIGVISYILSFFIVSTVAGDDYE